ncbi:hypothetical protein BDV12DRAFT_202347 [Aspergillus spectabilis]
MGHLQDMPSDILMMIISYIHKPKDITALSIQFRRVHALCDLPTRRKYSRIRIRKDQHLDNAFKILLSILRKPRLGLLVHRLEVDRQVRFQVPCAMRGWERSVPNDDLAKLKTAISAAFTGDERDYVLNLVMQNPPTECRVGVREGSDPTRHRHTLVGQALAALLITVCPHLEHLVIVPIRSRHIDRGLPRPPLDLLLERVKSSKGKSEYLQEVRAIEFLTPFSDIRERHAPCSLLRGMRLVRRLPNLSTVSIAGLVKLDGPVYEYRGVWSKVCCIQLHHCDLNTEHLTSLLCCVERLRKFTYTPGCVDIATGSVFSQTEPPQKFNPATLLRCLLRHKDSLESLDLDLAYQCIPFGDSLPISVDDRLMREKYLEHPETKSPPTPLEYMTGSLRDCSALTRLKIDVVTLFYFADGLGPVLPRNLDSIDLVSQLPPDLHSLRVRGYEPGKIHYYDRQLWTLLRQGKKERPFLQEVKGIKHPIKQHRPLGFDPGFFRHHVSAISPDDWTDYEY